MRSLASIVGDEVNRVMERSVLRFSSVVEDWQAVGGSEQRMEMSVCGCESKTVGHGGQRIENMNENLVGQIGEFNRWSLVMIHDQY